MSTPLSYTLPLGTTPTRWQPPWPIRGIAVANASNAPVQATTDHGDVVLVPPQSSAQRGYPGGVVSVSAVYQTQPTNGLCTVLLSPTPLQDGGGGTLAAPQSPWQLSVNKALTGSPGALPAYPCAGASWAGVAFTLYGNSPPLLLQVYVRGFFISLSEEGMMLHAGQQVVVANQGVDTPLVVAVGTGTRWPVPAWISAGVWGAIPAGYLLDITYLSWSPS